MTTSVQKDAKVESNVVCISKPLIIYLVTQFFLLDKVPLTQNKYFDRVNSDIYVPQSFLATNEVIQQKYHNT